VAKFLMLAGAALIALGLLWHFGGKYLPLGRLPGDIAIEKENFRFYFPIATCIVLSIVVSAVLFLVNYLRK
jgi:hypothetical protein